MIRKAQWVVLASLFLVLAFGTGCTSNTASAPPAQVTTVAATGAYAQNTTLDTPFALMFTAKVTTNGSVVGGVVVTFTAPTSGAGGTFAPNGQSFYSTTTNASGIATSTTFSANGTAGTYNVIAASPSTESTATFYLSNTLVPAPITVSGGSPQSTSVSTQFATALSVTVTDGSTPPNPVSGLPVTFTVNPASGAGGTFTDTAAASTTATTNSSGVATAAPFLANATVNPTVGLAATPYTVTASTVDGANPPDLNTATFDLYNTIVPAAINPVAGSTPQSTPNTTAFAVPLAVTVMDGSATPKPVVGAVVTFTAPSFTIPTPPPVLPATAPSGTFSNGLVTIIAVTDTTGTATAGVFTANSAASPVGPPVVTYNVTATVVVGGGPSPLSTNFVLTNQ